MHNINFNDIGSAIEPTVMKLMGSKRAYHKLGDISRTGSNKIEYILIYGVKPEFFVGRFVEGFGFINVHFPHNECYRLNPNELKIYNNMKLVIN